MRTLLACSLVLGFAIDGNCVTKRPSVLSVTEGDPSSFVSSCVNVLTGDFFISQEDLTIEGQEPIHLKRSYVSGNGKGKLAKWSLQPHLYAFVHGARGTAYVPEPTGATLYYSTAGNAKIKNFVTTNFKPLNVSLFGKGLTNSAHGEISGRTNLKNNHVSLSADQSELKVFASDGTERCYGKIPGQHSHVEKEFLTTHYYLLWEKLPHGNMIHYSYDRNDEIATIKTTNGSGTKTYAWAKFSYKEEQQQIRSVEIETSNAKRLQYQFRKLDERGNTDAFILEQVVCDGFPEDEIDYSNPYKPSSPLVTQRRFTPGNAVAADYYAATHNSVNGQDIVLNNKSDPRYYRVKELLAPIGDNGNLSTTHSFVYTVPQANKQLTGITEVYQNDGSKTIYRYTPSLRLKSIENYDSKERGSALLSAEQFIWENDTNLLCRTFLDQHNNPVYSRRFFYDNNSNVTLEKFYGNLSGTRSTALKLNAQGLPEENGIEWYAKRYTYSQDGRNLLLKVEEDNGQGLVFSYLPNSDLVTARLHLENGKVRQRDFFEYNEELILLREISDNGSSLDKADLTGVNVRKVKAIIPRTEEPFIGLPHSIEERYVDLETNEEKLLKRTDLIYSADGNVAKQEIYDANNSLAYTLQTRYNSMGYPIEERNAFGKIAKSIFDANGNKILYQDFNGKGSKRLTYDFANRLAQVDEQNIDGTIKTTSYKYNLKGNKVATIDPQGNETHSVFDAAGHELATHYPAVLDLEGRLLHPTTYKQCDALGRVLSETNAKNETTSFSYTVRDKPFLIIHPDNGREKFIYSLDGTLKTHYDQEQNATHYTYDFAGRVTSKKIVSSTGGLLSEEHFVYDAFNLLAKTDAEGNTTTYAYDSAGRKIAEEIQGEKTLYTYDNLGRIASIEKGTQNVTQLTYKQYDFMDRVIEERVENGKGKLLSLIRFEYDNAGNTSAISRIIDGQEAKERFLFDAFNRLIQHTNALGDVTKVEYDGHFLNDLGQIVTRKIVIDTLGNRTIETQDALGRLASIEKENAEGLPLSKEELFYDAAGNLARQVSTILSPELSPRMTETRWEYGPMKRLLTLTESYGSNDKRVTRYTYTHRGLVSQKIKPDGVIIHHTYDGLGRLVRVYSSDYSVDYSFTYDRNGRQTSTCDLKTQRITARELDAVGRILEESQENGLVLKNRYDTMGRRIETIFPDNSTVRYTYDALNMKKVIRNSKEGLLQYMHHFAKYDLSGNLLEERPIGGMGRVIYNFDVMGRKAALASRWGEQKVLSFDVAGNIEKMAWKTPRKDFDVEYQYDNLHQLTQEEGIFSHSYTYDSHQNRLSKDGFNYQVDPLKQLLSTPQTRYFYDPCGNLICKRTAQGEVYFRYDALDRLVEVTKPYAWRLAYTYDGWNRRQEKFSYAWKENDWNEQQRLSFLYDDTNEIGAADASGNLVQLRVLGRTTQADIGATVAIELGEEIYAPLHDLQGNISALLSFSSRTMVEQYRYTAFGEEKAVPYIPHISQPWRFSSKRIDDEIGLAYFGMRYYDPETGHWLTPDPHRYIDGPNMYAFALNNPLVKVDLSGLQAIAPVYRISVNGLVEAKSTSKAAGAKTEAEANVLPKLGVRPPLPRASGKPGK